MWDSCKFNPYTGKPVKSLEDLILEHRKGVLIEDFKHDWNIVRPDNKLHYYSRFTPLNKKVKILIEYQ